MKLDIRLPIGLLFSLLGALLICYGLLAGPPAVGVAARVNLNAWWGLIMSVFGAVMLLLARRSAAALRQAEP